MFWPFLIVCIYMISNIRPKVKNYFNARRRFILAYKANMPPSKQSTKTIELAQSFTILAYVPAPFGFACVREILLAIHTLDTVLVCASMIAFGSIKIESIRSLLEPDTWTHSHYLPTPNAACFVPTYWYAPLLYAGAVHLALRFISRLALMLPQARQVR